MPRSQVNKRKKKSGNRKSILILILMLGALGAGGYYWFTANAATDETETEAALQTAVARRGDLIIYASASGEVVASTEVTLGFEEYGTLSELLVELGDDVRAGEVLGRLETDDTAEAIAAEVAQAQLAVLEDQKELDDLHKNADKDAALALLDVEQKQQALDNLLHSDTTQAQAWEALIAAQEGVKDSQTANYISQSTASQANIDAAWAQVILSQEALEKAQENFDPHAHKAASDLTKANFQAQLSAAQGEYDAAVRNYNAMTSTGSELDQSSAAAELATAQAALADAERAWERAKGGPSDGEIALAEAELALAAAEWERLRNGADPEDIALAEAELANAQANLYLALEKQAILDLVSPIDGTIVDISAEVGETLNDETKFITVADLNQPRLEVYLDETDIMNVAVGYEVEVVFDAFPDEIFDGTVIEVDPSLYESGNITTIKTLVELNVESFSKPIDLPIGLNAAVDVIGGRAENGVLVPVEALRELGDGEYAVFVVGDDGEPRLRMVEVGIMDFTSAEIISGLEAGEEVTTGIVETSQ
jgi:HlyD family secretion protein